MVWTGSYIGGKRAGLFFAIIAIGAFDGTQKVLLTSAQWRQDHS